MARRLYMLDPNTFGLGDDLKPMISRCVPKLIEEVTKRLAP